MPTAAARFVWHHPHFTGLTSDEHTRTFHFTAFTGDEDEPEAPDSAYRTVLDITDPGHRIASIDLLLEEVRQARRLWSVARYTRQTQQLIRDAADAGHIYHRARREADDAYTALTETSNQRWQIGLFRLIDARAAVLAVADAWDRAAEPLSAHQHQRRDDDLRALLPSLAKLGAGVGVDTSAWTLHPPQQYRNWDDQEKHPTRAALTELFADQDRIIKKAAALAPRRRRRQRA